MKGPDAGGRLSYLQFREDSILRGRSILPLVNLAFQQIVWRIRHLVSSHVICYPVIRILILPIWIRYYQLEPNADKKGPVDRIIRSTGPQDLDDIA